MTVFKKHPGRLQLLLLATLFALPLAAAIFLHVSDWRPTGTSHTGVLLAPPRTLLATQFMAANGGAMAWDTPARKWRLVYVAAQGCDDHCRALLATARQVRLAQGKERDRIVRRLVVLAPPAPLAMPDETDLTVIHAAAQSADAVRAAFQVPAGSKGDGLFVVDPLGNVMMYYPPDADPSGMRKDLKRLLQVSQIG